MKYTLLALAFVSAFTLAACGNKSGTPESVVRTAYLFKGGDFSTIHDLFLFGQEEMELSLEESGLSQEEISAAKAAKDEELRGIWNEVTHDYTVKDVKVVKQKVEGDHAKLLIDVTFEDGTVLTDEEVVLFRSEGSWKISVN